MDITNLDVRCAGCGEISNPNPPTGKMKYGLVLAFLLGLLGFGAGLTVGIATAGFGIAAAPFTVIIGLYAGYKTGGWIARRRDGYTCPACDQKHNVGL